MRLIMCRPCLGYIVLAVITVMTIIVLASINYAEGIPNEDENHLAPMPIYLPNVLTYTRTETTVKNLEKGNPTPQDSTLFEITDSDREVDETKSEIPEVSQIPYKETNFDSVTEEITHAKYGETEKKCSCSSKLSTTQKSERDLRRDIFRDYDKGVRPVKRPLTPVYINITVTPLALISASESKIVLDTYLTVFWMDDYLQWDPCEYGGITQFNVPISDIWKPDVGLITATPDTSVFPITLSPAIIHSCGKVHWFPQFTISSRCLSPSKDMLNSSLSCNFLLGSWSHENRFLTIEGEYGEVSATYFAQDFNPDWKLVRIFACEKSYGSGTDLISFIHYNITLNRKHY